jgi:hypothetical protein
MNLRKSFAILGATVALLALGAQPMLAIGGLRSASPSAVEPAAGGYFGADLDSNAFPSNAFSGWPCPDADAACTQVMNRAYGGGIVEAPKAGYVDKIRLIAGEPGSVRLFFVKVKPGTKQAKAVKKGPVLNYAGQPDDDLPMAIQTFDIPDIYVQKGWRLAIKGKNPSLMRCDSGNGSYVYQPGLTVGAAYRAATDTDSCAILIKAIYR